MKLLIHWLILAIAVFVTPYIVSGITVNGILTAIIVAAILGFINMTIKPIIKILTLPLTIITLGLFSLVLNAIFFWLVATVVPGFHITSFVAAFWGALVVSIINWIVNKVSPE